MYNMCIIYIYICMIMKASSWYLLSYSYLEWPCSSIARSPGSMWYITSVSLLVSDFHFPFFFFCPASPSVPTRLFPSSFLYLPFFSVHQTASPPQASSDHENWKKRKDLFIWLLTRAKESQEWLPLMWNWTLSLIKQGFSLSLSLSLLSLDMQSKHRSSQSNVYPPDLSFPILSRSPFCLVRLPVPFLVPLPVVCFPFRCFQWSFDIRRHQLLPFPDMEPPWNLLCCVSSFCVFTGPVVRHPTLVCHTKLSCLLWMVLVIL